MGGGTGPIPPVPLSRRAVLGAAAGAVAGPALGRAVTSGSKLHVAVIGAGVFGAWTARHLQLAGHKVTLVDARGPANNRASSGGESRMARAAYGKDAIYTKMALDSLTQWKALERSTDLPLFIETGVLFFFPSDDPYLKDSLAAHSRLKLPTELLSPGDMARRFPMIDAGGVHAALYEPGFGALMARRAVQTLVRQIIREHGHYLIGNVAPPNEEANSLGRSGFQLAKRLPPTASCSLPARGYPSSFRGQSDGASFPPGRKSSSSHPRPATADFNPGSCLAGLTSTAAIFSMASPT